MAFFIIAVLMLSSCAKLPMKNPIKMMPDGIVETIDLASQGENKYLLHLRISATFEMGRIDFEPRLQHEAEQKAHDLCLKGIKHIEKRFEEITVLDYAKDGYNLLNNMYAHIECQK